jgi:hypothetical protein
MGYLGSDSFQMGSDDCFLVDFSCIHFIALSAIAGLVIGGAGMGFISVFLLHLSTSFTSIIPVIIIAWLATKIPSIRVIHGRTEAERIWPSTQVAKGMSSNSLNIRAIHMIAVSSFSSSDNESSTVIASYSTLHFILLNKFSILLLLASLYFVPDVLTASAQHRSTLAGIL